MMMLKGRTREGMLNRNRERRVYLSTKENNLDRSKGSGPSWISQTVTIDAYICFENWLVFTKVEENRPEENPTGLLTAIPPSIMLNSRFLPTSLVWGSFFVWSFFFLSSVGGTVKYTGGKYVGAAVVARHTSLTNALFNGSCSMIGTQDPSSSD